jgi:hemerythrin superfamily protein
MDVITAITDDHRLMERLFARLQSGKGDPGQLVAEIRARLRAHSIAEEDHVYPALARREPGHTPLTGEHHGAEEHRDAEAKLAAVEAAIGTPRFAGAVEEFVEAVIQHVEEEEQDVLPSIEDAVDPDTLDELGATFEERRIEELALAGITDTARTGQISISASTRGISAGISRAR